MRTSVRAFALAVLAILTTSLLGVASAFMAAFAVGATALIVPGTGTPDANNVKDYRQNAADRYIAPFVQAGMPPQPVCTSTNGCTLRGIDYPASFWPLGFIGNWCPGYQCDKWDVSVGTGVEHLDVALHDALDNTTGEVILFGYSQGGAVVSNELRNIGDLTPDELARLRVVMIGNAFNPDGGIFTRLGFLGHIPGLDVTFGLATPVDTGVPMTAIGFEYDPVMYAPLYWGNGLTMLNALAAFQTVHGYYLTPNGNGPNDPIAYGYTKDQLAEQLDRDLHPENFREDSEGNVYVMIPAKGLPIVNLVSSMVPAPLQSVVKPVADLVSPVLKVLIDLGYDWSGDPGQERWLSPLPFNPIQNWPAVGVKLVVATVQGIQAFIGDLGGLAPTLAPTTQTPVSTTPVSTLAAATTSVTPPSENKQSMTNLTLVKGTTEQQPAVETETTSASTEETPASKPESTADGKKTDEKKADEAKADEKADESRSDGKADERQSDNKADKTAGDTKSDDNHADAKPDSSKKGETDNNSAASKDAESDKKAA